MGGLEDVARVYSNDTLRMSVRGPLFVTTTTDLYDGIGIVWRFFRMGFYGTRSLKGLELTALALARLAKNDELAPFITIGYPVAEGRQAYRRLTF